jgi:hypothetical protein
LALGGGSGLPIQAGVEALHEHYSVSIQELDNGVLFLIVSGEVREEDIDPFFETFQPMLEERTPARILVDGSQLGETGRRVRWELVKRMRANKPLIDRTAIFGLPPRLETVLWILFSLSGRSNIRTFLWRHEAEAWLAGKPLF